VARYHGLLRALAVCFVDGQVRKAGSVFPAGVEGVEFYADSPFEAVAQACSCPQPNGNEPVYKWQDYYANFRRIDPPGGALPVSSRALSSSEVERPRSGQSMHADLLQSEMWEASRAKALQQCQLI
jgi:hypothetical protein